ncbi:copper-sensing transcription factor protein [Rutstroemia sp. NJR-2017a BBW]|nr:copper-sensing transcription factor protein [Rutstroemia sp. NJR-2017a BBW]
MPLINGLKMACEPCIRGHRSTKCTHANERLMVPVRKPGRPLSACPHPKDQPCGCGSVTAAIPRKQACHCGTDTPVSTPPLIPQRANSTPDAASPTQLSFKVQKTTSRPPSSRKQSFDPANLERMDLNQVNIMPFDQHAQRIQMIPPSAYQMSSPPQSYGFAPQYPIMPQEFGGIPSIPLQHPQMHNLGEIKTNGHTLSNGSSISEPQPQQSLPKSGGCCSSKKNQPLMPKPMPNPINSQNGFAMNSFSQFPATVFTYPPTYGSYQNPLQPSAWAQGVRDMSFAQQPIPTAPLAFDPNAAPISENLETVHTCGCGDACQCIGCAAHPYNDATQDYVRSAWASMQIDQSDAYPTGNVASLPLQTQDIKENPTSPPPATPSSTASGNAEEQTLSASDFFFVNYPFSSEEGCGGDTQSCPCGDDCECIGCTIHRGPEIPCPGEKDTCPCGDDCACIGCSIHNLGVVL